MRRPVVATPPATDSTCDLVFLHGFLGTPTEWLALLDRLPAAWPQPNSAGWRAGSRP